MTAPLAPASALPHGGNGDFGSLMSLAQVRLRGTLNAGVEQLKGAVLILSSQLK